MYVGGQKQSRLIERFCTVGNRLSAVDGVVCCMKAMPSGRAEMVPVSAEQPLSDCRHFVACHALHVELESEGETIQAFYGRLGIVLLGTVMDGD